MEIPKAFNEVCIAFHQDILRDYEKFEDAILSCPRYVTKQDAEIARTFIDALLSTDVSDEQLEELWSKTPSDWHVSGKGGARHLLAMISKVLQEYTRSPA